jgi:hypothetical protein
MLLLLYWMWSSENLDGLNGGGWGVFIAWTTILAIVVDGTPDSPVVHRTWHCSLSGACHISRPLGFGAVDYWIPLSSWGTGQSGGRTDSLVAHRIVRCVLISLLWPLTCALFIIHLTSQSTVGRSWSLLRSLTEHVRCTPDSLVNYSGATLGKTRERPVHGVLGLGNGQCPVRHWQHLYLSLLQTL